MKLISQLNNIRFEKHCVGGSKELLCLLVYLLAIYHSSSSYLKGELPRCEIMVGYSTLSQLQKLKDKDLSFSLSWVEESGETN